MTNSCHFSQSSMQTWFIATPVLRKQASMFFFFCQCAQHKACGRLHHIRQNGFISCRWIFLISHHFRDILENQGPNKKFFFGRIWACNGVTGKQSTVRFAFFCWTSFVLFSFGETFQNSFYLGPISEVCAREVTIIKGDLWKATQNRSCLDRN